MVMELDWTVVEAAARSLGVTAVALKKWRQRGSVPHRWRLPIIRSSNGQLSLAAFDEFEVALREDEPA
jgi:hypothetical protein